LPNLPWIGGRWCRARVSHHSCAMPYIMRWDLFAGKDRRSAMCWQRRHDVHFAQSRNNGATGRKKSSETRLKLAEDNFSEAISHFARESRPITRTRTANQRPHHLPRRALLPARPPSLARRLRPRCQRPHRVRCSLHPRPVAASHPLRSLSSCDRAASFPS
jgi:hypothetical protein